MAYNKPKVSAEIDGQADPEALYIISIGGNDTYAVEDLGAERAAELSSDFALGMVRNLVEGGANYILIPNRFVDERTNLTSFNDLRNQQAVQKIEDYLALDTTPDDVEAIYGDNHDCVPILRNKALKNSDIRAWAFI